VFEGLLSPTHLIIIAVVLFVVVGPRKMQARWHSMRDAGRRIIDDTDVQGSNTPAESSKRSRGYRVGRLLRRR
jgi:Sec-independent protein translocase protein TatA